MMKFVLDDNMKIVILQRRKLFYFIWDVCGGLKFSRGIRIFLAAGDFLALSHPPLKKILWH